MINQYVSRENKVSFFHTKTSCLEKNTFNVAEVVINRIWVDLESW